MVRYAVALRAEFIPEGAMEGPCRTMYFKVFAAGTSSIVGAVLGWPTLDFSVTAGSEGLGWATHHNGFEYKALKVILPRTDDVRRISYASNLPGIMEPPASLNTKIQRIYAP